MSVFDLLADGFPHGTVEGFNQGCRGSQCPAVIQCRVVQLRYAGDYGFRKRLDAGMSVDEIVAAERVDAAVAVERVRAVRVAQAVVERAPRVKVPRPVKPVTVELSKPLVPHGTDAGYWALNCFRERDCPASPSCESAHLAVIPAPAPGSVLSEIVAERSQLVDRLRTQAPREPKPLTHGTNAGYARGCRCEPCHEAHKTYHRDYAAMRRKVGAEGAHGTPYGYQLGCRRAGCPGGPDGLTCADASLAEEKRRRREKGVEPVKHPVHGTRQKYKAKLAPCHLDWECPSFLAGGRSCRQANAEYQRERVRARQGLAA